MWKLLKAENCIGILAGGILGVIAKPLASQI
jgi:hypothetical protein